MKVDIEVANKAISLVQELHNLVDWSTVQRETFIRLTNMTQQLIDVLEKEKEPNAPLH